MLEKNKDYVEFTLQRTSVEYGKTKDYKTVSFDGYSDSDFPGVPMDVVCKEFGHKVVMVGKGDFEKLQAENEQLKKKLEEFAPVPGYREFLTALYPGYPEADIEKLVWATEQLCCGRDLQHALQVDLEYYRALSGVQICSLEQNYETLSKLVGFSSVEEIQEYLTNNAECDTLQEAILKLTDENKYVCEGWYKANRSNNSWKAAAECNSPKELMKKRAALDKEIEVYSRALQEWKDITGYPSPSAAKTALESGASWCHAYNEVKNKMRMKDLSIALWKEATGCPSPSSAKTLIEETKNANEKLDNDTTSWRNVTGYSTPEDYMHAKLNNKPLLYCTDAWQEATGCNSPEEAKSHIEDLEKGIRLINRNMLKELDSEINEWQKFTGCASPQEAGCKINNLCDEITGLKGDYDRLLKLTGYKSEDDIRVTLEYSEQFVYETMRELINSLKRKANFTEANWRGATGCETPEEAETTMRNLRGKIDEIKEFAAIASNWTDRIVED